MWSTLIFFLLLACISFSSVSSVTDVDLELLDQELSNLPTASLINILEQQGIDIGDNYFTNEELIRLIKMSIDRDDKLEDSEIKATPEKQPEQTKTTASPVATGSNAQPSVWQQVKDQFSADIAPFLALIPSPVKALIRKEIRSFGKLLGMASRGAVSPMLLTAAKLFDRVAQLFISFSNKLKTHEQEMKGRHMKGSASR